MVRFWRQVCPLIAASLTLVSAIVRVRPGCAAFVFLLPPLPHIRFRFRVRVCIPPLLFVLLSFALLFFLLFLLLHLFEPAELLAVE